MAETVGKFLIEFEGSGSEPLRKQLQALSATMNSLSKSQKKLVIEGKKVAAQSTKLNSKTVSLTAKLAAQNKTWKQLGVSTQTVSLAMQGNIIAVEKLNTAYKKSTVTTRILGGAISVLRSKLLIYAFAAQLVFSTFRSLHKAVSEFQVAQGKLNGVLRSTGSVSGKTASQLANMADKIQVATGVSNTAIMEMQARLLTFTSIVGKQFTKTIDLAVDMSNVLDVDMNGAILQMGKALNDPIKGVTALTRVGVSFTNQQKEQIKTLQESGDIIGAQRLILSELTTEFGGATNAINEIARSTARLKDLQTEWGDTLREIGLATDGLVLILIRAARAISETLYDAFSDLNAMTTWAATFLQTWTVVQSGIRNYIEFEEALSAAGSAFTKFRSSMGGYSKQVIRNAKANKEFTNTKQIQEWTNSITEAMSKDKRAEILDKISEALVKNNFLLRTSADLEEMYMDNREKSKIKLNKAIDDNIAQLSRTFALLDAEIQKGSELTELEKAQIKSKHLLTIEEKDFYKAIDESNRILAERTQEQKDALKAEKEIAKEQERIRKEREKAEEKIIKLEEDKKQAVADNQASLKQQHKEIALRLKFNRDLTTAEQMSIDLKRELTSQEKFYANAIDKGNEKLQERIDKEKELADELEDAIKLKEEQEELFRDTFIEFTESIIEASRRSADSRIADFDRIENRELEQLRNSWLYKKSSDTKKAELEKEVTEKGDKARAKARKKANKEMLVMFRMKQALDISETIMSTEAAYMATLRQTGFFGIPLATIVAAQGALAVGLIAAQQPPTMKYGGMVGGQSHAQGGTMVNAEKGEFVMRREAVQAVGIETMNRINQGGGGGSVNVSFNGNVLSKDFIEDEAIPQIKEAIRRGADIGVG